MPNHSATPMCDAPINSVATLIVKPQDTDLGRVSHQARQALAPLCPIIKETVLATNEAMDLYFSAPDPNSFLPKARQALKTALADMAADFVVQPTKNRQKRLLVADMDSTMITAECVDELADYAGLKDKVAAITEAAMRGELDFERALRERVLLLKGLDEATLLRCYQNRVIPMAGAETLIRTMGAFGAFTMLVSGGFTFFTQRVAKRLGFQGQRANRLSMIDGVLTGDVESPIVDATTKRETLKDLLREKDIARADSMAVGDGANDILMLKAAA
ncbi:hypothetical protein JCM17843_18550 [Kordiimonadales bacterium JCM 17843]|nr:hypothetical protein JCM17843_18550 [Kordiimonadales bacterium JCM 17843]